MMFMSKRKSPQRAEDATNTLPQHNALMAKANKNGRTVISLKKDWKTSAV
jgi:hypothetical protein